MAVTLGIGLVGPAATEAAATTPQGPAPAALVSDPGTPVVSLITGAPNGPFSSGQYIEVKVAPNPILKPKSHVRIEECVAPSGGPPPRRQCDPRTRQHEPLIVNKDGSVDDPAYPIYALPDNAVLGESSEHLPVCDLSHACVLLVGLHLGNGGRHVSSLPFGVDPTPGDTGANPGNGLPEVPYVLALPVLAAGIVGGSMVIRRRRSRAKALPTG